MEALVRALAWQCLETKTVICSWPLAGLSPKHRLLEVKAPPDYSEALLECVLAMCHTAKLFSLSKCQATLDLQPLPIAHESNPSSQEQSRHAQST